MKKKMILCMICTGMLLYFFYLPVQADGNVRDLADTIGDRFNAKSGPAALICMGTGDQWVKNNKSSLQAKGIKIRRVMPHQHQGILKGLKVSHHAQSNPHKKLMYLYPVTSQQLADSDFLELTAFHSDFFYLDEFNRFYYGNDARKELLLKIGSAVKMSGCENAILSFFNWFDYLYKNYEGTIPVSFTLFVPSKRQDGTDITEEEIDQVLTDFYNRIVSRFAEGFSVFRAEGSWVLDSNVLQNENVKMATVDAVLDKREIFATTLLLIVQALDVQVRLDQDSVMIKVLNFPFFIGN
ncbi:MAG: DUF3574 domain-containing protein [bacterium]|nr:DUF3574 domain-containing protein [bacterium]